MSVALTQHDVYTAQFQALQDRLPGNHLAWVRHLREDALERFAALGFPTTRLEDWKYTDIAPIRRTTFEYAADLSIPVVSDSLRSEVESYPSPRLVFINGMLDSNLSTAPGFQAARLYETLADSERSAAIEGYLGQCVSTIDNAFAAWNTAFFLDGACVVIPPGQVLEKPVHLVFVAAGGEPRACHPRNLIVAGENCRATFVETFLGQTGDVYLTNTVTEMILGPGAAVEYYRLEKESSGAFQVANIGAHLHRDAELRSYSVSVGGALVRNELRVTLDGKGAHCMLNGLFAAAGRRLVDNHTYIDHRQTHTSAREIYKGLLSGYAEGVFNGAITVRQKAQKTSAVQHSINILLSDTSQINTKPQLEIEADDVQCVHGATVGPLDSDMIFYLRSRGVEESECRRMLIRGFVADFVDDIRVPSFRQQTRYLLDEWIRGLLETI